MKQEYLNSRFLKIIPMTAEETKSGGCNLLITFSFVETSFGEVLIASTTKGVCYLAFVTESRETVLEELKHIFPCAAYEQRSDEFQQKAIAAFEMNKAELETVSLHIKGTDFQMSVWKELPKIPLGGISSYGKLAALLLRPKACRAVGTAVGDNPVSILIPCHRVLRTDGGLGGYHWGLDRKIQLLDWEKAQVR